MFHLRPVSERERGVRARGRLYHGEGCCVVLAVESLSQAVENELGGWRKELSLTWLLAAVVFHEHESVLTGTIRCEKCVLGYLGTKSCHCAMFSFAAGGRGRG